MASLQSLPYCWHTNILLESPSRSHPFNVVYKPLKCPRKEFDHIVLSNIEWGKGGVCGPTTYDSDCSVLSNIKRKTINKWYCMLF